MLKAREWFKYTALQKDDLKLKIDDGTFDNYILKRDNLLYNIRSHTSLTAEQELLVESILFVPRDFVENWANLDKYLHEIKHWGSPTLKEIMDKQQPCKQDLTMPLGKLLLQSMVTYKMILQTFLNYFKKLMKVMMQFQDGEKIEKTVL